MKTHKTTKLVDGNGNKLKRKIRKDSKGLFVINHGRRGTLIKTVKTTDIGEYHVIDITRKVDFYTEL